MDYVFEFSGGIGRHIMFSSFIKWVSEKFPESKITVISAFPEIFEYNSRIYRNLPLQQAYLFEDYIKGKEFRKGDPYHFYDYYREENKRHFNEICPLAFGFTEYNETPHNEIFLTKGERNEFIGLESKKIVTLQISGGIPMGLQMNPRERMDSSDRNIPFEMGMRISNILRMRGYEVLQVRGPTEQPIPGTNQMGVPFRNLVSFGLHCRGHIGIDSSMMHAMAAFDKPQLIFWGQTHVDNLGYKYPKVMNICKENAMKCMPHLGLPDRNGVYPRTDPDKESYWDYTPEELEKQIDEFISVIK